MSGETEAERSGWTVDTLRYHFQQQLDDLRRMLDERYATQTKAVEKALDATERRFEGVNEFRAALTDQTNTFIPRTEAEAALARNAHDIQNLTDRITRADGSREGVRLSAGFVAASIAGIASVVVIVNVVIALFAG